MRAHSKSLRLNMNNQPAADSGTAHFLSIEKKRRDLKKRVHVKLRTVTTQINIVVSIGVTSMAATGIVNQFEWTISIDTAITQRTTFGDRSWTWTWTRCWCGCWYWSWQRDWWGWWCWVQRFYETIFQKMTTIYEYTAKVKQRYKTVIFFWKLMISCLFVNSNVAN